MAESPSPNGELPPATASIGGPARASEDVGGEFDRLRGEEAEFQELIEHANDIVYAHDLAGYFLYVNEAGLRTYGYSREEIRCTSIRQIVDPEFAKRVEEIFAHQVQGMRAVPFEILTHARDGRPIYVEVSIRLVRGSDGNVVAVQGIARDVSERKRAAAELEEHRELLRATIESTADGILVVDAQGRVLHANQRFAEMWRIPDHVLAEGDDDRLLASVLSQVAEPEQFLTKVRELYASEAEELDTIRFKDGRVFERYSRPLRAADELAGRVWSFRDVTEHQRLQSALEESEQLYRQVFRDHSAVQVLVDLETRTVVEPNDAACSFYGYERNRFIGMDISQIDAPMLEDEADGLMASDGRRGVYPRRHTLASDETRDVEVFAGDVHVGGKQLMMVIVQDVTERRRAEVALARHQRLLEEKSALLAVALESERERARRDPLTGVLNHAAIMDALREAIASCNTSCLATAMVDVDGLKAANDTYGHQMGDAVLSVIAEALKRDGAVVGRYGGDEFMVILPGATREAAERYGNTVVGTLENAALSDPESGAHVPVLASIGLAVYPEEASTVEDLIQASDNAMFVAKRERAAGSAAFETTRALGGDRTAAMVGELVPFLTSPGSLDEKLRLVAQRLTTGAGYAGVSFALFSEEEDDPANLNSFAEAPSELVERWDATNADEAEVEQRIRPILDRTQRPMIIDDVATTPFISDQRRQLLLAAHIHSAIVAPMIWQGKVIGALSAGSREVGAFGPRDAQFLHAVATQVTAIVRTDALVDELQSASNRLLQAHQETVLMLAKAAEAHDQSTGRHLHRVRSISQALARELGQTDEMAKEIGVAAILHDIGKIRVPDYILTSRESLGDEEWTIMKQHTVWGSEFLGDRTGFVLAAAVARSHHERWDGSGYPFGLAGEQIPLAAAITAVADSLDAMTSDRPYRSGRPLEDAILEVQAWSGSQFSPAVVDALVRLYERGELPGIEEEDSRGSVHTSLSDDLAA